MVTPNRDSSPDSAHRIPANETTDTIDLIAPNGSVPLLVWCGVLGCGPDSAVNTSISDWMR